MKDFKLKFSYVLFLLSLFTMLAGVSFLVISFLKFSDFSRLWSSSLSTGYLTKDSTSALILVKYSVEMFITLAFALSVISIAIMGTIFMRLPKEYRSYRLIQSDLKAETDKISEERVSVVIENPTLKDIGASVLDSDDDSEDIITEEYKGRR